MHYIAVDPGNVSGIAVWQDDKCTGYEIPARLTTQVVRDFIRTGRPYLYEVAIERYTITPGIRTPQPAALMVMGALEYMCDTQNVVFSYYTPGLGKRMCDNDRLRKLGWWQPTKDGHANDAKRILLAHISVREPELFAKLTGI